MDLQELLKTIQEQEEGHRIGLAASYLKGMFECRDGVCGFFPEQIADASTWKSAIARAEQTLVCTEDDSELTVKAADGQALALSKGSICDFIGIMTSNNEDRDGDILETKGAQPDPHMPGLWMHSPWSPFGKVLDIPVHTPSKMKGHFAIMDGELGQDCAHMVENKMVSLSIGFRPIKWKKRPEKEDSPNSWPGYHFTKFEILECSLVTVRSNPDAIITDFTRGKFHAPMVKLHAAALKAKLPPVVTSGWEGEKPEGTKTACTCGQKAATVEVVKTVEKTVEVLVQPPEPTIDELATKFLARVLKGEHPDPRLTQSLTETLAAEQTYAQERALAELVAS